MTELARQAAHAIWTNVNDHTPEWWIEQTINNHGTLVSHERLAKLNAYEAELQAVRNILQNVHPMGAAKHIGLRESATALAEVVEKQVVSHQQAALLREVERLKKSATDVEIVRNKRGWFVSLATDSSEVWHTGDDDTLTAALESALDAAGVPDEKGT